MTSVDTIDTTAVRLDSASLHPSLISITATMTTDSPFNVAIIGYGMSAKVFHIPLISALPDFHLHGIVQRSPKPTDDASTDHPGITTWRSADDMLLDPSVDLVIITSTPTAHYDQALAALRANKHVVVEKPFVPTAAEARSLIAAATQSGRLLSVYQNRRWDQDFLTLRRLLDQGTLGPIAELESHYDRYRPSLPAPEQRTWKNRALPAGGALFDLGSHLLDQVYVLFGPPRTVTGFVGVQKRGLAQGEEAPPPDHCTVLLDYGEEGQKMLVTVKSSSMSAEEEQLRFWVRGAKGSYKKVRLRDKNDVWVMTC